MVRYRRRWRHDPYYWPYGYERTITGVIVGAVIGAIGTIIGGIAGAGWRYRSELAPFAVAGVVVWAGQWTHTNHPGWSLPVAVFTVAVVAALAAVPRRWRRVAWPWLGRGIERAYIAVCT